MESKIRRALASHAKLAVDAGEISNTQNLFDVGLTSFACVQLMMRLEEVFDVEFPDELLKKATFESIAAIEHNIERLSDETDAVSAGTSLPGLLGIGTIMFAGAFHRSLMAAADIGIL